MSQAKHSGKEKSKERPGETRPQIQSEPQPPYSSQKLEKPPQGGEALGRGAVRVYRPDVKPEWTSPHP